MSKNIKKIEELSLSKEYELIETKSLPDLKGLGIYLRHKKSGARVVVISNNDDNKVFYIGFRTPSYNSTGVAHIVEHTVLCGSKKFPSKDPFVELIKGSLNTFLNAVTYPDRTLYPIASLNDKDFKNLMEVYLDAVFYPNLHENKAIFDQEGWHYEIDPETKELKINGVVYNEMKGAFSSPESVEDLEVNAALFPDSPYGKEYGGDPDVIPELTYEAYKDFHKTFYHPSNSYIYLYGDMDIEERLDFLHENYLKDFDSMTVESEIPFQNPVSSNFNAKYSIAEGEDEKEKTFLSYNVVTGESTDIKLMMTLSLIQYVMTEVPGAPIKRALTEAGIGNEIYGSFNTSIRQPVFSIHATGSEANKKDDFTRIIEKEFENAVKNGIPEKMLRAAINYTEFKYKEQDYGRYPKGLLIGIKLLECFMYDDSLPFRTLDSGRLFDELRSLIGTGYFEDIITKYILFNEHKTIVAMLPEKGLNNKKDEELRQRLSEIKEKMSEEELLRLKEENEKLTAFQTLPSKEEDILKIPMLKREDIKKEPKKLPFAEFYHEGMKLLQHEVETNGIVYLTLNFDVSDMEVSELPYINLLGDLFSLIDTKEHEYNDFISEVLMSTGGLLSGLSSYQDIHRRDRLKLHYSIKLKVLKKELSKGLALLKEMIYSTKFDSSSDSRIVEILKENMMRSQMVFESSGDKTGIYRGHAYTSVSGMINDRTNALGYYRFIKELVANFDSKRIEFYKMMNRIIDKYFVKERAIISLTANSELYREISPELDSFIKSLPSGEVISEAYLSTKLFKELEENKKNREFIREAYTVSGQVQYVTRCGNYKEAGLPYTGLLSILQVILSYEYLWLKVRVKGGAYGCYGRFDRNGDASFSSYRDPKLMETNEVYEGITSYLENFEASDRDITKFIIGAISNIDLPLTPYQEGNAAFSAYLSEISYEERLKAREEILSADVLGIRGLSKYVKAILDSKVFVVVGSESKIRENEENFNLIESVLA